MGQIAAVLWTISGLGLAALTLAGALYRRLATPRTNDTEQDA
jgi:hypothetical protein